MEDLCRGVLWDPAACSWRRSIPPYPFGVPGSSAPQLREVETPLTLVFTLTLCPGIGDMQAIQSYSIFINPVSTPKETS